jgi:hypothetical protein
MPSGFNNNLVIFALCCAVAAYFGWPYIKGALPESFPSENHGAARYDAHGYTGDPGRFDRSRNAERGGQREYSQFYPRDGGRPDPGSYGMRRRGEDGEGDYAGSLPRQPETDGYGGRRKCMDTKTHRFVDPSFCERPQRR